MEFTKESRQDLHMITDSKPIISKPRQELEGGQRAQLEQLRKEHGKPAHLPTHWPLCLISQLLQAIFLIIQLQGEPLEKLGMVKPSSLVQALTESIALAETASHKKELGSSVRMVA